jgi:hypothetical protein
VAAAVSGAIADRYRQSWFAQPTGATNLRMLVTSAALVVLAVAVLWVARNQFDQASHEASQASYENARDERLRCEQRVDSRDQLRGVFLSIFDLINEQAEGTSSFVTLATERLDADYPPLRLDDCPPIPTPPGG